MLRAELGRLRHRLELATQVRVQPVADDEPDPEAERIAGLARRNAERLLDILPHWHSFDVRAAYHRAARLLLWDYPGDRQLVAIVEVTEAHADTWVEAGDIEQAVDILTWFREGGWKPYHEETRDTIGPDDLRGKPEAAGGFWLD